MLAEIFAILAGHESSLFARPTSSSPELTLAPAFAPLLHPGERSAILSLAHIASLYSSVRQFSHSPPPSFKTNEYVFALCSAIRTEVAEYEALVVQTERDVLAKDESLVGAGSFVPLSSLLAIFSEWERPLAALDSLVTQVKGGPPNLAPSGTGPRATDWPAGPLIDLVHRNSLTGYTRVSALFLCLLSTLQRILIHHLTAYLLHGIPLSPSAIPSCISAESRESITYVGHAVAIVMKESWESRLPREIVQEWTKRLAQADMLETQKMDRLIADLRTDVSEWLWTNVLRKEDIVVAIDALADYFLLRNGEFASSFIREVERLKRDRLKSRTPLIRAQDIEHALLRSSLGTAAESDPALSRLGFVLPTGPVRPFLFLPNSNGLNKSTSFRAPVPDFSSLLLGTPAHLTFSLAFPLSLFLTPSSLQTYAHIHTYLTSLRRCHLLLCDLWSSLSLAQRKRRRWVRLGEGGEGGAEGEEGRRRSLLRRTWGCVREMVWFFDVMVGYLMGDVVEVGYKAFRERLAPEVGKPLELATSRSTCAPSAVPTPCASRPPTPSAQVPPPPQPKPKLDFTTLRNLHTSYLTSLLTSSLLASLPLLTCVYDILQICERLVGQVERWGGDVLPELLGAAEGGTNSVEEREAVVDDIYETFTDHLRTFYSLLATSPLLPPASGSQPSADASTFLNHSSTLNTSSLYALNGAAGASGVQARRQVEHLMLKMDFNGVFSGGLMEERGKGDGDILKGLAAQ